MVEIFKTDVQEASAVRKVTGVLLEHFGFVRVSFDLEDCDRILRIESDRNIDTAAVEQKVRGLRLACFHLKD